ncbi:uncharacterized protein BT62DRAFT_1006078 [Guyanagaster necrorhizus]|uniref:Uncharacterized protein n=1 Tax=Guyanagaster necrorhizus TaxID=856835 RepID=A0A9P8AS96_9AGAR|nr:uncharacterized protein BT62DRAFT_1006078 [Guyanagaster necrorhizus MCA 3950]KAG7445895.1 hypothetical protein BT62DRAFT_1006078 [Guyanagaster necrorhizus MCA 3950]
MNKERDPQDAEDKSKETQNTEDSRDALTEIMFSLKNQPVRDICVDGATQPLPETQAWAPDYPERKLGTSQYLSELCCDETSLVIHSRRQLRERSASELLLDNVRARWYFGVVDNDSVRSGHWNGGFGVNEQRSVTFSLASVTRSSPTSTTMARLVERRVS